MVLKEVSGFLDKWVMQNLLYVLPVICSVFAFALGAGVENRMDILPDDSRRGAAVTCSQPVSEVPVINEVAVYAKQFKHTFPQLE